MKTFLFGFVATLLVGIPVANAMDHVECETSRTDYLIKVPNAIANAQDSLNLGIRNAKIQAAKAGKKVFISAPSVSTEPGSATICVTIVDQQ